ncbi:aldo/keto reductase [Coraliomargarita akajimensis]|uniref:L-fucose dehydrogenase n=1 Tax=Coraliomargarita akajimensis (strain DSM 45221 / IAM 15411 / JCM 23193 / KCTC 12865 / 04OKA010-24) TaxID=583355 RepID=D5EPK1_CORAD|nr:aldo/keto reductase [Coraliomargarita akajimensis]ADE53738.1 L-fucose dehydrogenase [Coraliomargarita akajimensis DSM 45221]
MNIEFPKIVFGSSALGNLYEVVKDEVKLSIVDGWVTHQRPLTVIDSAGKYGAGLALENIGKCLKQLNVSPDSVLISNKLGWKRTALEGDEPTFEKGVWFGLEHDAKQAMGYDGILECYEQGNELLGDYTAKLLSVHDPDEYIAAAADKEAAYQDILDSYRALVELRDAGKALGIGVGSKDWTIIKRLFDDGVSLDWVMFANSYTLYRHPAEVMDFMLRLNEANVSIINSAVFNAGFLIGGKWFDYREVTRDSDPELFDWRDRFMEICVRHSVTPALACCQFGLSVPGTKALALNTSRPERIPDNIALVSNQIASDFWTDLKAAELIDPAYPFL